MEIKIEKVIKIINIISGIVTVYSFLINNSGIISFLLLVFTLLLRFLSKIVENQKEIEIIIRENFLISNEKKSANNYFILLSILYILLEFDISILGKSVPALILFMIVIPICYSLSMVGILSIDGHPSNPYGTIHFFITPFPYYLMILYILLDHNGFLFELGTVFISVIFYVPVFLVSKYVRNRIK